MFPCTWTSTCTVNRRPNSSTSHICRPVAPGHKMTGSLATCFEIQDSNIFDFHLEYFCLPQLEQLSPPARVTRFYAFQSPAKPQRSARNMWIWVFQFAYWDIGWKTGHFNLKLWMPHTIFIWKNGTGIHIRITSIFPDFAVTFPSKRMQCGRMLQKGASLITNINLLGQK